MRKLLMLVTMLLVPALANAWTFAVKVTNTTAGIAAGNKATVTIGATSTDVTSNLKYFVPSGSVTVAVANAPSATISLVGGTLGAPVVSGTTSTYTIPANATKTLQTLNVVYATAATAVKANLSVVQTPGGMTQLVVGSSSTVKGFTGVPVGTSVAVKANPSTGYSLQKIQLNGVDLVGTTFNVADATADVVTAFYTKDAVVTATLALAQSGPVGTPVTATVTATGATGYAWTVNGVAQASVTNAMTFTPVNGANMVQVTIAGASVPVVKSASIMGYDAAASNNYSCTSCHSGSTPAIVTNYAASGHTGASYSPTCASCHSNEPHNIGINASNISPVTYSVISSSVTVTSHGVTTTIAKGGFFCAGCHNGTHAIPHPTTGLPTTCTTCHAGGGDIHQIKPAATAHISTLAGADCAACHQSEATAFTTSQHGTRQGKATWYNDNLGNPDAVELQKGFGNYVQTTYAALPCAGCHNGNDNGPWDINPALGTNVQAYPGPNCLDCHSNKPNGITSPAFAVNTAPATEVTAPVIAKTCYGCHSRQINEKAAGLSDVHMDGVGTDLGCMDCHSSADMHGTGTLTASQLQWGTISAQCENCHGANKSRGEISSIPAHVQHAGNIACSTCHAESMITCHNCHFDNEAGAGGALKAKFFSGRFGGTAASGNSWRFLVNRKMEDGSYKIYPGSMQSLAADYTVDGANDGQGHTHAGIAPYYSHTITRVNALSCDKCHGTETAVKLAGGQPVRVTTWNAAAGVAVASGAVQTTFVGPKGVIPVPENPKGKLLMDFVDLTNPELGTASNRVLLQKDGPDTIHMPEAFVKPLTAEQMRRLALPYREGATTEATAHGAGFIPDAAPAASAATCGTCHTGVNTIFSTGLHGTLKGKDTFFSHNIDNPGAVELQKGFGNYVNVTYAQLPCKDCHNGNDNGPWDTNPAVGTNQQSYPGPVCTNCHSNQPNGILAPPAAANAAPATAFGDPVIKQTCYGCHSRQVNEITAGLSDVHGAHACSFCHAVSDFHGDGTAKASMLEWGAISAKCENCHASGKSYGAPLATIPEHDTLHLSKLDCSTCHAESMITCHNCHFDNEYGAPGTSKAKFFSAKFGGTAASGKSWRFLVNRVMPDGSTKVYPGSMQSLVADYTATNSPGDDGIGHTHAGIAPYYSHSITRVNALRCDKCHGIPNAIDLNNGTPIRFNTWNGAVGEVVTSANTAAKFTPPSGVIPVPENPTGKILMDFVDLTGPAPLGSTSSRVLFQKDGPDTIHMHDKYVKPLTPAQINSLATPQVRP